MVSELKKSVAFGPERDQASCFVGALSRGNESRPGSCPGEGAWPPGMEAAHDFLYWMEKAFSACLKIIFLPSVF